MWGGCCHGLCSTASCTRRLIVNWSKRVSVLRHALPKLKSSPIYTDSADDAAVHKRLEMATRHLSINRLYAENNHTFEFTPLCV